MIIDERHAQSIDLDLTDIVDDILMQSLSNLAVKVSYIILVIDVSKRKHEPFVGDFAKLIQYHTTHALGWGVLETKVWIGLFKQLKLVHRAVEFRIGNTWIIQDIVFVCPLVELFGKR